MKQLHAWNLPPNEAKKVQTDLWDQLVLTWDDRSITTIAGVDMSLKDEKALAAIAVFTYPDLKPLEAVTADMPLVFPYIPGLLAFREGPAVLAAWEKLHTKPDLLMFDGQGIAHPRGVGIASQMGLWLERPTIGVAKSRLFGKYEAPGLKRGDQADLRHPHHPEQVIGVVLRTRDKGNPLYISPGHLIDLPQSVTFVLACNIGYRLPETTRWAHKVAAGEVFSLDTSQQLHLL